MERGTDTFSGRLRQLRAQRGLSRRDLAMRLGVSAITVWQWEAGRTLPRPANRKNLCRALGVAPKELKPCSKRVVRQQGATVNKSEEPLQDFLGETKQRIASRLGILPEHVTITFSY